MVKNLIRVATTFAASTALVLGGLSISEAQARPAAPDRTRIAVAPKFVKQLKAAGIEATALGNAKSFPFRNTVAFRFQITRIAGHGNRISHSGGVKFSKAGASLPLTKFRINLRKKIVSAVVGGDARATLFDIKHSKRPKLGDVRLVLNKLAAGQLNTIFDVHSFKRGKNFGFAKVLG